MIEKCWNLELKFGFWWIIVGDVWNEKMNEVEAYKYLKKWFADWLAMGDLINDYLVKTLKMGVEKKEIFEICFNWKIKKSWKCWWGGAKWWENGIWKY